MLIKNLESWIGRTQTLEGGVDPSVAGMLGATLGGGDVVRGDVMPPLWHWAAFTPKVSMDRLSGDGHPERGDFLPPVDLPRRMWAGGEVQFLEPLTLGEPLRQASRITDVAVKSEAMTFVTVEHEVIERDVVCVRETQNIVYLQIPQVFSPPKPIPVPQAPVFDVAVPMSETLLFRYSAATFNGHRIHYDLPYAQQVEKYPGLVVHGPLQATLLLQAACAHAGRRPAQFKYRGVHPMFHDQPLHLQGYEETPEGMRLCTAVPGQHMGMQATVIWEET